jgi:hypothetical protein
MVLKVGKEQSLILKVGKRLSNSMVLKVGKELNLIL